MPHRRLARRLVGLNWLRWELGSVVAFHAAVGVVILLAPDEFVITPATWAIFYFSGRLGMGAAFLAVAAVAAACWWRPWPLVQLGTWLGVYMIGAGWLTGFAFAVHAGSGGLYGLIFYSAALSLWASTAVRLATGNGGTGVAGKRYGQRGGR